jgi:putative phosphoesterase
MRIGILSDTHNNIGNLLKALRLFREENITTLVHCGDMCNVTTAQQMTGFDVIYVNGNMDSSAEAVNDALWFANPNSEIPGAYFSGKVGGVKIGVTHGHLPGRLDKLIKRGGHAFVFTGHTHRQRDEQIGKTRVINPGALGGARYGPRTVCIVDLDTPNIRFVEVSDF